MSWRYFLVSARSVSDSARADNGTDAARTTFQVGCYLSTTVCISKCGGNQGTHITPIRRLSFMDAAIVPEIWSY